MRFVVAGLALTLGLSAAALADETLPPRKPGLWEFKAVGATGVPTTRQCIDSTTDDLAGGGNATGTGVDCSKKSLVKTATGYEIGSTCKNQGFTTDVKILISGDFNSTIRMDSTITMTGLPNQKEPMTQKTAVEMNWIGPCQAGQNPGDIILPNGTVMKTPQAPKR